MRSQEARFEFWAALSPYFPSEAYTTVGIGRQRGAWEEDQGRVSRESRNDHCVSHLSPPTKWT